MVAIAIRNSLQRPSWSFLSRKFINSSALVLERTQNPRPKTPKEKLTFGTTISDHMLVIPWDCKNSWGTPKIIPYQNLSISPAACALHYGLQCFEGMKAYRSLSDNSDGDSQILMFRPDCNLQRFSDSMNRLHFGCYDFDQKELLECIKELVRVDKEWIPHGEGYSLYIRPTMIGTNPFLGVAAPQEAVLYVITSPVGPYYKTGFKPVRLTADTEFIRAWPGGAGNAKVGGNYALTMKASSQADGQGYSQVLWLFGDEITEVGSMNVFFVIVDPCTNKEELITPPLTRGDILPGVTRRSALELELIRGDLIVSERSIGMPEVLKASKEGRLKEAFGTGTAAVISPISCIQWKDTDIDIPAPGRVSQRLLTEMQAIQYGKIKGPEGWSLIV
mmetsp:Transcript_14909/g.21274  ORF Transcript_14909/g.21274 Transcript_14909/m.21274 type:complete len:390 (+) Transcript_14909:166-1335(+)